MNIIFNRKFILQADTCSINLLLLTSHCFTSGFPTPELPVCDKILGMQDGSIPSSALRVSSELSSAYGPTSGRLHGHPSTGIGGAWMVKTNDNKQWFQVDFGSQIRITGLASQGRQDAQQYVKSYSLQYSNDGFSFQPYQQDGWTKVGVCSYYWVYVMDAR